MYQHHIIWGFMYFIIFDSFSPQNVFYDQKGELILETLWYIKYANTNI